MGPATGFTPGLVGAERYWSSRGAGDKWSNPFSWVPFGVPENGDDLVFGGLVNINTSGTMLNDLVGLTVHSMTFDFESEFLDETWILNGNELTVTGDVTCTPDKDIEFNCGLVLGRSIRLGRASSISDENTHTIRFNGPLQLGPYDLTILSQSFNRCVYRFNGAISGSGHLQFINDNPNHDALAVFGGNESNNFSGALTFQPQRNGTGDLVSRPFQASFDKPGGSVVTGALHIGDGCEVAMRRSGQIGDDTVVSITGGGRLLLNGHPHTLGSLLLTNVHADAEATLVDASGTTLTLRGGITTSVFNEDGHVPTIRGTLALPSGPHLFDLNTQLPPGLGLELPAQVTGFGGFSKLGNGTLVLATSNSFSGPVSVNAGVLEIQNPDALGSPSGGVTLADGTLILRDTFVHNETLFVRGTRPVTANTAGSFLNSIGFSGWLGRIQLNTNLVVNSTDLCILGGPILGPGGFEFLGSRHQITGGSSVERSDFFGPTRIQCELLTVNLRPAFRGNVIVGGGFGARHELQWGADAGSAFGGDTEVFIHTNGLVNLNGFNDSIFRLHLEGGRVVTGAGTLNVGGVLVHPTNITASIDGHLQLASSGTTLFTVHDGSAKPDLSITAIIDGVFSTSGLEKDGNGQMDLHRANVYGGSTVVKAGTLGVLHDQALGPASQGTTIADGASVAFGAQVDTVVEPFAIAGFGPGGVSGALQTVGDVLLNTNLVLNAPAGIRTEGTNSRLQVNNISGTGPLTKLGSGRLVLRGAADNTHSGETLVTEGVLDLAKPNGVVSVPGHLVVGTTPNGATAPSTRVDQRSHSTIAGSVTVNAGGLWDLNGATQAWRVSNLQGRPPLTLNEGGDVQTGAGIFILPVGGGIVVSPGPQRFANSTISGRVGLEAGAHRITVLAGNQSLLAGPECNLTAAISEVPGVAELEKDGAGTLRLAGTNSYRGVTSVAAGTLQVDGVQLSTAVRVANGARLQGNGTVGPVEMLGAAATVAPGGMPGFLGTGSGILTCSNFGSGAINGGTLFVKLNGGSPGTGYDQINARGGVRLSGLRLQGELSFAPSLGQTFVILNNDGTDPVQGEFDGLPQSGSVYLGGERFSVSYTGGTGNDVVLTREITPQLVVTTLPAREEPNRALDFDGRFTRVHVSTNAFPTIANDFTIELWANPTAGRLETPEANLGISDLSSQRHAVFPDQGDFGYGAGHAGAGLSIGTNGISAIEHAANHLPAILVYSNAISGWTHFALVYSNRVPRLYVNGSLARVGLPSVKSFVHPSANLGGSIQGLTYGNFQGQLDEVRIWNGARTAAQIQTNRNRSLIGDEPGLVLYFRCEETNNAPLVDSAPASPNLGGTLLNGVASVPSGALPPAALNGPTVTLTGLATPGGLDASVWFEWGPTTNYGHATPARPVSAVSRAAGFVEMLAGLAPRDYQFRAVGSNGLHFAFGLNQSFTLLNGAPVLNIERLAGSQVRLLWPTNLAAFSLQTNLDLVSSNWIGAALPTSVIGTNHAAVESTAGRQKYYRLFKP